MVAEWGSLFVLTADGGLLQLEEKDTQTKLDTLFKKNLYSVAINLARTQQCENAVVCVLLLDDRMMQLLY